MLDDELLCPGGRDRECPAQMVCGPDLVCRDACRGDRDCLADQTCLQGVCANPAEVVAGALPINPQGVVRCVLNSDCSSPLVCRSGGCVRECRENRDCALGAFCADAGVCATGDATPGASLTPGRADAGRLSAGYGEPCVVNSDCRNRSLRCLGGRCGVECFEALDCNVNLNQCCTSLNRCATGPACLPPDAGVFDPPTPDGGCRSNADCQDTGRCNGTERCIDRRCRAAERTLCDDGNPCTVDVCAESGPPCSYTSVRTDVDQDGRFPVACGGSADDCDDSDATTYPGAPELCDFKDNNCNGVIDEALWRVKPGSRGTVGPRGAYPPLVGRPQAVMHKGEIVVVAPSNWVRGTLDAFTLDPLTLTQTAGPLALGGSRTLWTTCDRTNGRSVGFPTLSAGGGRLLATAIEGSYGGTLCCSFGESEQRSSFFVLFDTPLRVLDGGTLTPPHIASNFCQGGPNNLSLGNRGYPPNSTYDPDSGLWILVWSDNNEPGLAETARAYFATYDPTTGALSPKRAVWVDGGAALPADHSAGSGGGGQFSLASWPIVATGNRRTLIAWSNPPNATSSSQQMRFVLYDSPPASPAGVPSALRVSPFYPAFAAAAVVPQGFLVATHTGSNASQLEVSAVFLDGGLSVTRRFSTSTNAVPGGSTLSAGSQPSILFLDGGILVASTDYGSARNTGSLRFQWTSHEFDAGTQSLTIPLGYDTSSHTDFALVAPTPRTAVAFWQDGDLQRVGFECVEP